MDVELEEPPPTDADDSATPLDQQILQIVKSARHDKSLDRFIIQPARLSADLGISIEDATAELCGLLAAVGGGHDGASFSFESNGTNKPVMVFSFPPDYEQRATRSRRKQEFKEWCWELFQILAKALKIITAFGLILSLCILVIAAMLSIVVGIVAMSTNQGGGQNNSHQRNLLLRQLRSLFFTIRQLLWCYALFGSNVHGDGQQQDPFLAELAYDLALFSSVCCGNPMSFFWWYRVNQLSRRRQRIRRGWGGNRGIWGSNSNNSEMESGVEGVRLVRRGDWTAEQRQQQSALLEEQRGLLSIAVEYLFGPSPFQPGPTSSQAWKLRAAAIVQLSAQQNGVMLQQLSPFMDHPPSSLEDVSAVVAGGLEIVAHFNGQILASNDNNNKDTSREPHLTSFQFPELLSESQYAMAYEDFGGEEQDDGSWGSLLCAASKASGSLGRSPTSTSMPSHLNELSYRLTKLNSKQFCYCSSLGIINLVGVIWLKQSLEPPNGMLQMKEGAMATVTKGLVKVLYFYAIFFFVLPLARYLLILILNMRRKARNAKRKKLAGALTDATL